MRESIAIAPAEIVAVWDILGHYPLPHVLEIGDEAGLELNSGHPGCGADDK